MDSLKTFAKAKTRLNNLAGHLTARGWHCDKLERMVERADKQIEVIVKDLLNDAHRLLSQSYLSEAQGWANNDQYDTNNQHINISRAEQRAAESDVRNIQKVINQLEGLKFHLEQDIILKSFEDLGQRKKAA